MQLLYTGALKEGEEQLNPDLSLGGLVSGSSVPNDILSNIFPSASLLSIDNNRRDVKMVVLKNNNIDIVTDIVFRFQLDKDSICNYKIAFVKPTIGIDHVCFEKINNSSALPYYANFQPIVKGSKFHIDLIDKDAYLGLWLMREYNYEAIDLKKKTCLDWLTQLKETPDLELNKKENFSFSIKFSIGEPSNSNSNSDSSSNSNSLSTSSSSSQSNSSS